MCWRARQSSLSVHTQTFHSLISRRFFQKAKAERLGDSDLAENGSKPETKVDHTELEDRKQVLTSSLILQELENYGGTS